MATEQKEITDPCAKYNEQTNFSKQNNFCESLATSAYLLRFNCRTRYLCLQVYEKLVISHHQC